jgi:hypothetical protein
LLFRPKTGQVDIKLTSKCEMSNAPVRHFDFDFSSKFLQVPFPLLSYECVV